MIAWRIGVEQAAGVLRLIQVVAQAFLIFLGHVIGLAVRRLDLRAQAFEFLPKVAQPLLHIGHRRAQACRIRAKTHAPHQAVGAFEAPRECVVFFFQAGDFSLAGHRGIQKFLVRLPGFTQIASLVSRQDRFPQEVEQQSIESFKPVLVPQIISQENILIEEEDIVLAGFDKGETIIQDVVRGCGFLAEKRLPGSRQAVLLDIHHRLEHMLARLPEHIAAVGLQFGQPRFDDMRLLGMLEMSAAAANPLLGFEHQVRELRADLLRQELQQSDAQDQVNFDILLIFG